MSDPEDHRRISDELIRRFKLSPAWASVHKNNNANLGSKGRTTISFFPVDNNNGNKDPVVQDLKKLIQTLASESASLKLRVPLAWIQCLDKLATDPRVCLSLEEARFVAVSCGISDNENNKYNYLKMLKLFNEKVVVVIVVSLILSYYYNITKQLTPKRRDL